jgi:predicted transcriptional regulator
MKKPVIAYCINKDLNFISIWSKREIARDHGISEVTFANWSNYKIATNYKTLKKYDFEDKWIEAVIWYPSEKKVVRFKDAKKKEEKELIKIFKENNE